MKLLRRLGRGARGHARKIEQEITDAGSKADGDGDVELDYPVTLDLYENNTPYEVEYHRAYIHEDAIEVDEVTVEKGPFDEYGLRHKVEGLGFVALKEALGADGPSLVEEVHRRFSGAGGIHQLKDFCETNGIEITTFII